MNAELALSLAAQIVELVKGLGGPVATALTRRSRAHDLRVAIAAANRIWADERTLPEGFPPPAEVVAVDIARLANTGRPLDPHLLADVWVQMGCDEVTAGRSAERFVELLDDHLRRIGWFTSLRVTAATLAMTEIQQEERARRRAHDVSSVAGHYFSAADSYVAAARSRLEGDELAAADHLSQARGFLRRGGALRMWRVISTFNGVELDFEAVEDAYEDLVTAVTLGETDRQEKVRLLESVVAAADRFRATVSDRASRPAF